MALMVEREARPELEVKAVPEEIELPKHLSELKAVETAYKATVQDGGVQLTTPSGSGATITVPADQKTLIEMAKGSITSAATWLAAFWLRIIKKAVHFGWNVEVKK